MNFLHYIYLYVAFCSLFSRPLPVNGERVDVNVYQLSGEINLGIPSDVVKQRLVAVQFDCLVEATVRTKMVKLQIVTQTKFIRFLVFQRSFSGKRHS